MPKWAFIPASVTCACVPRAPCLATLCEPAGKVVGGALAPSPWAGPQTSRGALFLAEHCHLEAPGPQLQQSVQLTTHVPNNGAPVSGVLYLSAEALLQSGWKRPARLFMSRSLQRSFGPMFLKLWFLNLRYAARRLNSKGQVHPTSLNQTLLEVGWARLLKISI